MLRYRTIGAVRRPNFVCARVEPTRFGQLHWRDASHDAAVVHTALLVRGALVAGVALRFHAAAHSGRVEQRTQIQRRRLLLIWGIETAGRKTAD